MNTLGPLTPTHTADSLRIAGANAKPASATRTAYQNQAMEKAQEFEAVFLTTFVEQMFSGIETDGPFGGGHAEKIYRSMMSQEHARSLSQNGGIGIADQVYSEILKAQEAGSQ